MKLTKIILFVVVAILFASTFTSSKFSSHDNNSAVLLSDIHNKKYEEWMQSMVRIELPMNDGRSLVAGSGWIISSDGYIVTNYHVVKSYADLQGKSPVSKKIIKKPHGKKIAPPTLPIVAAPPIPTEIDIEFSDGTSAKATFVGGDEEGDVAVLKVNVKKTLRPVVLEDSSKVKIGQNVFILGNPLNEGLIITHGIVSNKLEISDFPFAYIETDATINPGNSGGALLDENGNLIGMPSLLGPGEHGGNSYAFAISSNDIKWVFEKVLRKESIVRIKLGIHVNQLKKTDTDTGLTSNDGLKVVDSANPDLQKDDVIVALNDEEVMSHDKLHELISKIMVGDHFTMTVLRNGSTVKINMIGSIIASPMIVITIEQLLGPKK